MDTTFSKEADTEYDVLELIQQRWSPRAFSDEPVEEDLLRQLFDAARWAPSSYNEQPWRFIVATKEQPEEYERMTRVLNDFNKKWAVTAPVLVLAVTKDYFDRNGKKNRHAAHDLGQAIAYLTIEATRHDISVHQMADLLPDKACELFDIPDGFTPMTMIALGYAGDPEILPEDLQRKEESTERSRLDIDEIAFRGSWNEPETV